MKKVSGRLGLVVIIVISILILNAGNVVAQGQGGGKWAAKQEMKQLNKEANKLSAKAEEAATSLDVTWCFAYLPPAQPVSGAHSS